jgi:beta-N-acetylhexosaminidase
VQFDLRTAIGQCLIVGVEGSTLSKEHTELLTEVRPGGIILTGRNGDIPHDVHRFAHDLRHTSAQASPIPLWLALDGEPGFVFPYKNGVPLPPSPWALGRTDDETAESALRLLSRVVATLGFDVNFHPVADVNVNSDNPVIGLRSFGDNPEIVTRRCTTAVSTSLEAGVLPCVKHYPGHGDTDADSHTTLPEIRRDEKAWEIAIAPFRESIVAGCPLVMTTHVMYPDVDRRPATLLPVHVGELKKKARTEWDTDVLVVSDAIEMSAISDERDAAEATIVALSVGIDLVLTCDPSISFPYVVTHVVRAVESGLLDESRVYDAAARVMRLKRHHDSPGRLSDSELAIALSHESDRRLVERIAVETVQVSSTGTRFPNREAVVYSLGRADSHHADPYPVFVEELANHLDVSNLGELDSPYSGEGTLVIVTSARGPLDKKQLHMLRSTCESRPDTALVQLWSPHHGSAVPALDKTACSFCPTEIPVRTTARLVASEWFS